VNYLQPRSGKNFDESGTAASLIAEKLTWIVREGRLRSKCFSWFTLSLTCLGATQKA
jgi:hypothetical protein